MGETIEKDTKRAQENPWHKVDEINTRTILEQYEMEMQAVVCRTPLCPNEGADPELRAAAIGAGDAVRNEQ